MRRINLDLTPFDAEVLAFTLEQHLSTLTSHRSLEYKTLQPIVETIRYLIEQSENTSDYEDQISDLKRTNEYHSKTIAHAQSEIHNLRTMAEELAKALGQDSWRGHGLSPYEVAAVRSMQYIPAIKALRERLTLSLKDAKTAVDIYRRSLPSDHPAHLNNLPGVPEVVTVTDYLTTAASLPNLS